MSGSMPARHRGDLCPGVLRPWPAEDGGLVRLRLVGGRLPVGSLSALLDVAAAYGDGEVHLTTRANLQLRALPLVDGRLPDEVVAALAATGLLPHPAHELVRNLIVSPATGLGGGRADLRPVADRLDDLLCAEPELAALPGRFLQVLDDGRGDLVARGCDLGLVALDEATAQVRVGDGWAAVVPLDEAPPLLAALALRFVRVRGSGPEAPWHVVELSHPLAATYPADPRVPEPAPPLPYGATAAYTHHEVLDGRLTPDLARRLLVADEPLVVTPWHGVLVPARKEENP